ncbi:MAG: choice-of-anchor J domain-containing protein [Massilia sp.]
MKTSHTLFASLTLAAAALAPTAAQAAGAVLLKENFNDVDNLPGWVEVNHSTGPGQDWFQGNSGVFRAQSGPADSYIANSYLSALNGLGTIDTWLITPELSFATAATTFSFYTCGAKAPGLNDTLEVRFSAGSGTDTAGFSTLITTLGGTTPYPSSWQQFSTSLNLTGTGRFAFHYLGDAGASNYIGIDTVSIMAVPEPSAWLMLGLGLGALTLLRRKLNLPSPVLKGVRHVQQ